MLCHEISYHDLREHFHTMAVLFSLLLWQLNCVGPYKKASIELLIVERFYNHCVDMTALFGLLLW